MVLGVGFKNADAEMRRDSISPFQRPLFYP
jgi:hypothetical protein